MKIYVMTFIGDADLIIPEEKGDLEYRKQQLKRLQDNSGSICKSKTGGFGKDLH